VVGSSAVLRLNFCAPKSRTNAKCGNVMRHPMTTDNIKTNNKIMDYIVVPDKDIISPIFNGSSCTVNE
jgi:hypothetical protein